MSTGGTPPPYYPPTTTAQAPPNAPGAIALPAGVAPPPGYVPAVRQRPEHLGLAQGLTITLGVILLVAALALVVAAFAVGAFASIWTPWVPGGSATAGAVTGFLFFLALVPLALGVLSLAWGAGLGQGRYGSWTGAVVVHIVSLVISVPSLLGGGFPAILTVGISGVAVWALFQPGVKAYCGH